MRNPTSKILGLGQGTVLLFDYTLVIGICIYGEGSYIQVFGFRSGTAPLLDYMLLRDSYLG